MSEANIVEFIWASLPYKPNFIQIRTLALARKWQALTHVIWRVSNSSFFSESNPHRHKLPWLGLVFCKIFQQLLPVTQGLLSSRPPWPPRIQRRIFPSKSKVILLERWSGYGCSKQLWLKGSKVSGLHWYAWRCMPCWHVYGNGWGQNFRPAVGRPRWAWLQEHLGLDQNYGHNDSQIWSSLVGKPLILGRIVLITQPGAWAWELISLRCSWRKHGERMFGWCKACFFGWFWFVFACLGRWCGFMWLGWWHRVSVAFAETNGPMKSTIKRMNVAGWRKFNLYLSRIQNMLHMHLFD